MRGGENLSEEDLRTKNRETKRRLLESTTEREPSKIYEGET